MRTLPILLVLVLLAGCAVPSAPPPPTLAPEPTAAIVPAAPLATSAAEAAATVPPNAPRLPVNSRIAGIPVGGLTRPEAAVKLRDAFAPLFLPITVQAGSARGTVRPDEIQLAIPLAALLDAADAAGPDGRTALDIQYNAAALEAVLAQVARRATPNAPVDLPAAVRALDQRLRTPLAARRLSLPLQRPIGNAPRNPEQLQAELQTLVAEWPGVVGIAVHDMTTDRAVVDINADVVFSAASSFKTAIALYTYALSPTLSAASEAALNDMIISSDNGAANTLLAASVGGTSNADAARGADALSKLLAELGAEYTTIRGRYRVEGQRSELLAVAPLPEQAGPEPRTEADRYLRTTPAELGTLYRWIALCAQGRGPLPTRFPQTLTAERCANLLAQLSGARPREQAVLGMPPGTAFAHKGGWIDTLEADAGLVRSSGGDYTVAIFVYDQEQRFDAERAQEQLRQIARSIYQYYNPG